MSIMRMSNLAAQRETDLVKKVQASSGRRGAAIEGAIDKIASYIPSEVIGTYVAVSGIIASESAMAKWIIFGASISLIPILTFMGNALAIKRGLTAPTPRSTSYIILVACVAFCAWAAALPDNPLVTYCDGATRIGGAAIIVLAVVLPRVAELLDIVPKDT